MSTIRVGGPDYGGPRGAEAAAAVAALRRADEDIRHLRRTLAP